MQAHGAAASASACAETDWSKARQASSAGAATPHPNPAGAQLAGRVGQVGQRAWPESAPAPGVDREGVRLTPGPAIQQRSSLPPPNAWRHNPAFGEEPADGPPQEGFSPGGPLCEEPSRRTQLPLPHQAPQAAGLGSRELGSRPAPAPSPARYDCATGGAGEPRAAEACAGGQQPPHWLLGAPAQPGLVHPTLMPNGEPGWRVPGSCSALVAGPQQWGPPRWPGASQTPAGDTQCVQTLSTQPYKPYSAGLPSADAGLAAMVGGLERRLAAAEAAAAAACDEAVSLARRAAAADAAAAVARAGMLTTETPGHEVVMEF